MVMFFLIRYQTIVARTREINFARQFSSVNLVHRMEPNIVRQLFGVCPFILVVQQSFRDALMKRLGLRLLSIRRRWQMEIRPGSIETAKRGLECFRATPALSI